MKRKTKFELEKENKNLRLNSKIIGFAFIIVFLVLTIFIVFLLLENHKITKKTEIQQTNFMTTLEVINSNCGSTFLIKKYNDNNWYIFAQKCKGDYCKSDYIKLEDCLK